MALLQRACCSLSARTACRAPAASLLPLRQLWLWAPPHSHSSGSAAVAHGGSDRRRSSSSAAAGGAAPPAGALAAAAQPDAADAAASRVPGAVHGGDKMLMMYTCKVCEVRSARLITKLAYHNGVVLVRCPGCNNLHLVADRLGYFEDASTDMEALAAQAGEVVRKGVLGGSGGVPAGAHALGSIFAPRSSSGGGGEGRGNGGGLAPPPAAAAGGADAGGGVIELTADDLRVLASTSKSVSLRTQREVVDDLEYRK